MVTMRCHRFLKGRFSRFSRCDDGAATVEAVLVSTKRHAANGNGVATYMLG